LSDAAAEIAFLAGDGCPASFGSVSARGELARRLARCVPHFPRPVARISARLVGDDAMDEAHRRYSGIPGTTDVLSFPAHDESDPAAAVEVDLIVAGPAAERAAALRGHDAAREILLYAVHGTLHACGLRDDTAAAAAEIHAEEDRILRAAGEGAVYAAAPRGAREDPSEGSSEGSSEDSSEDSSGTTPAEPAP
jgi:rRNA maturation RNase YbeY